MQKECPPPPPPPNEYNGYVCELEQKDRKECQMEK